MSAGISPRKRDLRSLAHDLANDLNAISMTLEAMTTVRDDEAQFEEFVSLMRQNIRSLAQISREISRTDPAPPTRLS